MSIWVRCVVCVVVTERGRVKLGERAVCDSRSNIGAGDKEDVKEISGAG